MYGEIQPFSTCMPSTNSTLTPGGAGRILGGQLKFDPADPRQGVFFVARDESETRANLLIRNMPSEVTVVVPSLKPGTYRLRVRAAFGSSDDIRTGSLEASLTVS